MRPFLLTLALLPFLATAQPGELIIRFAEPCGFAPPDSIDLTGDGIPDVVVQGTSNGTDDVPSSSGSCTLNVVNLPGTGFLTDLDAQGYRQLKVVAPGELIKPLETGRRDDLYIPRLLYSDDTIPVAHWGYGHWASAFTPVPNLSAQRYVFCTMSEGKAWHGSFTLMAPNDEAKLKLHVGALVPADQPFKVP
ncbi:MAG: hypothetical protein R2811_03205 [Flavobacteriales bacterium]